MACTAFYFRFGFCLTDEKPMNDKHSFQNLGQVAIIMYFVNRKLSAYSETNLLFSITVSHGRALGTIYL